jgi:TRAP-type C4-dicarboxylate transport system permease small subunit
MSHAQSIFYRCVHPIVKGLEVLLVVGMAILVVDVLWGVFSRYALGEQTRWTEELAVYLLVWISLLGAALTFREKGHLGVDYFVGKLEPSARRLSAIFVEVIVFAFSAFALVHGGWNLVIKTLASGQVLPALNLPMGYVYSVVPISGVVVCLFAIEHLMGYLSGTFDLKTSPDSVEKESE